MKNNAILETDDGGITAIEGRGEATAIVRVGPDREAVEMVGLCWRTSSDSPLECPTTIWIDVETFERLVTIIRRNEQFKDLQGALDKY